MAWAEPMTAWTELSMGHCVYIDLQTGSDLNQKFDIICLLNFLDQT